MTAADTTGCEEDLDGDGTVAIGDLLQVLESWGDQPDCSESDDPDGAPYLNWQLTSHWGWHPSTGKSFMSADGRSFSCYDRNGGEPHSWDNFNMAPGNLYHGPSSDTDILKITMTLDLSQIKGMWSPVNPALYLIGMYDTEPEVPFNFNTDHNLWYYSDANNPPGVLGCDPPPNTPCSEEYMSHCVNGTIGVTTAELDLFELGSASSGASEGDGLPNVMQVTTHAASGDGGAQGLFIGLRDKSIADYGGNCERAATDHPQSSYPWQLLTCNASPHNNYFGLQIEEEFEITYEIRKTHMYIKVNQGSHEAEATFWGSDGQGIKDWGNFRYFAIQASCNNLYFPCSECGLQCAQAESPAVSTPWVVKDMRMYLKQDGGSFETVQPVELSNDYSNGFFWGIDDDDECSNQGYPLTVQ